MTYKIHLVSNALLEVSEDYRFVLCKIRDRAEYRLNDEENMLVNRCLNAMEHSIVAFVDDMIYLQDTINQDEALFYQKS